MARSTARSGPLSGVAGGKGGTGASTWVRRGAGPLLGAPAGVFSRTLDAAAKVERRGAPVGARADMGEGIGTTKGVVAGEARAKARKNSREPAILRLTRRGLSS